MPLCGPMPHNTSATRPRGNAQRRRDLSLPSDAPAPAGLHNVASADASARISSVQSIADDNRSANPAVTDIPASTRSQNTSASFSSTTLAMMSHFLTQSELQEALTCSIPARSPRGQAASPIEGQSIHVVHEFTASNMLSPPAIGGEVLTSSTGEGFTGRFKEGTVCGTAVCCTGDGGGQGGVKIVGGDESREEIFESNLIIRI